VKPPSRAFAAKQDQGKRVFLPFFSTSIAWSGEADSLNAGGVSTNEPRGLEDAAIGKFSSTIKRAIAQSSLSQEEWVAELSRV